MSHAARSLFVCSLFFSWVLGKKMLGLISACSYCIQPLSNILEYNLYCDYTRFVEFHLAELDVCR